MAVTAIDRAPIVRLSLRIRYHLVFGYHTLLRNVDPEMRARKLARVDQLHRALVGLYALEDDR